METLTVTNGAARVEYAVVTEAPEAAVRGWRDEALDAGLAAEAMDGTSVDAVLREVRRHRPGAATMMVNIERAQLLRFLRERCGGFLSLVAGSAGYRDSDGDKPVYPYCAWYGVQWEGATVEVAIAPGWSDWCYAVLCINEPDALERFTTTLQDFADRPAGRCLRYAQGWQIAPDMDAEIGKVTWDDIVLRPDTMAKLREAVEGFFAQRGAFASLGFPWRRGVLLVGPPGTGKTMVCKATATALPELPFLYVRDLRERNYADSVRAIFDRARRLAPCILAFEDMDGFVTEGNRSVFLNELDGFKNNDGLLIIASSNHPGKIDEALLKRPSRFDRVFHLGLPEQAERQEFCRRILGRPGLRERLLPALDAEKLAGQVAEWTAGFTPAYLKEAVLSAALAHAQAGGRELDQRFAEGVLAQVEELKKYLKRIKDPDALAEMRSGNGPIGL